MNELELLEKIFISVSTISTFLQILFYGIILLIVIYFGYWFFSRFFY